MKRLSLMIALLTAPTCAMAQSITADAPEAPAFVAPLSMIGSGDHPPSTTETSPAKARSVRRGGRTVMLRDEAVPASSAAIDGTRLANAGS